MKYKKIMIKFTPTFYLTSIKEDENFKDEEKIFKYAQTHLEFKYGHVDRERFNRHYSAEGWLGRKVLALPIAAWALIVKTIYHVAKAILIGIPKIYFDNRRYILAQFLHVGGDLQETYGRLTSIF